MPAPDAEQLAALWMKAQPTIAGYISSLVPDFHQADDILQNVAVIVVRKRESYDTALPFVPWAISIAKFEVLKHRRTMARDRHRFQFDETLVDQLTESYEQAAERLDSEREAVRYCVDKLEARPSEAIRLRHYDGLKPPEIAVRMQITAQAARALLYRARKTLAECISKRLKQEIHRP